VSGSERIPLSAAVPGVERKGQRLLSPPSSTTIEQVRTLAGSVGASARQQAGIFPGPKERFFSR
jgi:hypothetical protein